MNIKEFAKELGYSNEDYLLHSSEVIARNIKDNKTLFITYLRDGRWAAWAWDKELQVSYFDTREEAIKYHLNYLKRFEEKNLFWDYRIIMRYSFTVTCDECGQILESDIHPWWNRRPEVGQEVNDFCYDCFPEGEDDPDGEPSIIESYEAVDIFVGEEIEENLGTRWESPFGKVDAVESGEIRIRPKTKREKKDRA